MAPVDLSIVIPTYNESQNLPLLLWLLHKHIPPSVKYELVVVDDSSPDGTAELAIGMGKAWADLPLKVLSRPGKAGLGSAYVHGLKHSSGEFIVLIDADLSHHPK
jgi:dolichol-phosphate mannosyltransferase